MINKIIQVFKRLKSYRQNMNPALRSLDDATFLSIVLTTFAVLLVMWLRWN